jgi:hypothetical protein
MKRFLDELERPLGVGDRVEVKHCIGIYGQTMVVRGSIEELDQYGGILVALDQDTKPFTVYGRNISSREYMAGDRYYICNAFVYSWSLDARVGRGANLDYEHGHDFYCRLINQDFSGT